MHGTTTLATEVSMTEDGCLAHADFFIGREFWTETGRWRCTDVGTRTICAISLERHQATTLHPDGVQTTGITDDPTWLDGPPYALAEHVFDEVSFGALYASPADVPKRL
ncbi:hypothetical protein [Rhodoferax sp.]|uniref:hypothetical protein n=1 Tax=Rhodoferax sp. TaxID=50421 RepID=UPI0025FCE2B7|nr:hypothetical protein [Rhodoferax sp.]